MIKYKPTTGPDDDDWQDIELPPLPAGALDCIDRNTVLLTQALRDRYPPRPPMRPLPDHIHIVFLDAQPLRRR